jgi:hypothetical protein
VRRRKHESSKHHEVDQQPGQIKCGQYNFEHQIRTAEMCKVRKKLHGPKKLHAPVPLDSPKAVNSAAALLTNGSGICGHPIAITKTGA